MYERLDETKRFKAAHKAYEQIVSALESGVVGK